MNHRMKAEMIWEDRREYIEDERDIVWYLDEYAGYYPLTEYDYNRVYAELVELFNQQRSSSLKLAWRSS